MNNASIIVCGQRFDVGRPVITFAEDASISAYTPRCVTRAAVLPSQPAQGVGVSELRYRTRRLIGGDRSLARLQQVVRQFVVHHDGMGSSRDCFRVLHDERGLSVHFLIDNNGDIYQTLDLVDCAFQAAGVNEISIGVELCNRGDALLYPAFYHGGERDRVTCTINGHQFLAYDYTRAQLESMTALGRALARIFPSLPQTYPQSGGGEPSWTTLAGDPREYTGYLGHFHVTDRKWDPGPFDFKQFIHAIRGRVFYPAVPGRAESELPDTGEGDAATEMAEALYDNNEQEGEGGYFPVGPMGETRLWHGGVHVRGDRGSKVVAPFAGKIVAARFRPEDDWPAVGSPNFVLLRHDLAVGGSSITFYSLLFHLDEEPDPAKAPGWLRGGEKKKWWSELRAGEVTVMDQPIAAGETIGRFGEAGRPGNWQGQIHFEVFSIDEIGERVEPGYWKTIDGSGSGRFCTAPEIVNPIDADHGGTLGHSEFLRFFHQDPARAEFHRLAVRHVSEWGDRNDWEASLNRARDFAGLPRATRHRLFTEQIEAMLWWGDELESIGLPDDKVVWTYHPVTFVRWLHDRLRAQPQRARGVGAESSFAGKRPPPEIKDDADATEGFVDDEDTLSGEAAKTLDLESLSNGYPDER
jgi:N-acetyl-anhydromuramyl-L-alanine amidase AmpD